MAAQKLNDSTAKKALLKGGGGGVHIPCIRP